MSATGFTYPVLEGTTTDFNEFLWNCAKACGAMYGQHESKVVDLRPKFDSYHEGRLAESISELANLKALKTPDWNRKLRAYYASTTKVSEEVKKANAVACTRLNAMLEKVFRWNPPTKDHKGLKDFMTQQLMDTIKWNTPRPDEEPTRFTVSEFRKMTLEQAQKNVEFYTDELRKDREHYEGRLAWLADLAASVPVPAKMDVTK